MQSTSLCSSSATVAAADLVPAKVKLYIFYNMPKQVKLKTILAPLCGKTPEQVMAPAVADSHKLGYDKMYRLLLDHVRHCTCDVRPLYNDPLFAQSLSIR